MERSMMSTVRLGTMMEFGSARHGQTSMLSFDSLICKHSIVTNDTPNSTPFLDWRAIAGLPIRFSQ